MTGEPSPNGNSRATIDPSHIEELELRAEVAAGHMRNANKLLIEASQRRVYAEWIEVVLFSGHSGDERSGLRSEILIAAMGGAEVTKDPRIDSGEPPATLQGRHDFAVVYVNYLHSEAERKEDLADDHSRMIGSNTL